MKRRQFLKIIGGGCIVAAGTGAGGLVALKDWSDPQAAFNPLEQAGRYNTSIERALSYGLLAPNPHNRQPWKVDITDNNKAVLYCDLGRRLPETDPLDRQITIGLGCFLEALSISASQEGLKAEFKLFPEGMIGDRLDERPIAAISLKAIAQNADPLFPFLTKRHTNRFPHDLEQIVQQESLNHIGQTVTTDVEFGWTRQGQMLEDLRDLTKQAMSRETLTDAKHKESVDLIRIGNDEMIRNPDGISLRGDLQFALNKLGLLTRPELLNKESFAFQSGLKMWEDIAKQSAAFFWLNTKANQRVDQINAGRSYMRAALKAEALGLSIQPMSQALQEYVEMADLYKRAHLMLAKGDGTRIQMLVRIGYAKKADPAPRWPLENAIL